MKYFISALFLVFLAAYAQAAEMDHTTAVYQCIFVARDRAAVNPMQRSLRTADEAAKISFMERAERIYEAHKDNISDIVMGCYQSREFSL